MVALLEVEFCAVKFCSVDEPSERRFANVPRPVAVSVPPFAVVKERLVVVAFVVVE